MATIRSTGSQASDLLHEQPAGVTEELRSFWKQFFVQAFNPFRPEQHYMRGPGPAWRAKHGRKQYLKD